MYSASYAQPHSYTTLYHQYGNYEFDYKESYIIQRFNPHVNSTNYDFHGTIIAQRVNNATIPDDPIQITLIDYKGYPVKSFLIFENLPGSHVPTCAAYNPITKEYCIAGINEDNPTTNSSVRSWFLFLDEDVNVIDVVDAGVDIASTTGTLENLLVTDIIPMTGTSSTGLGDFVFVGVAGSTVDPTPINNLSLGEKELYVGYISSTTPYFGPTRALKFSTGTTDFTIENKFVPSRIVEIPLASPDGGFVIAGSVYGEQVFFTRLDYTLANNGTTQIIFSSSYPMYIGDMYFDTVEEEVWIAGSFYHEDGSAIIYQKLIDLTSPGISFYPDLYAPSSQYFGSLIVFSPYFVKIAKIMPSGSAVEGAIASYLLESPYYSTPDNYNVPMLNKINYSDAVLDISGGNSGNQLTNIYTYPRLIRNNGLSNYLNYLDYSNLWYPAHWAHEFPYTYAPDESYELGSCGALVATNPEYLVMNRTFHYSDNECNYVNEDLFDWQLEYINTAITPGSDIDNLNWSNISNSITSFSLDYELCEAINNNEFKQNVNIDPETILTYEKTGYLHIQSSLNKGTYKIYSSQGSLISQGHIQHHMAQEDFSFLSKGLYIIQVFDTDNKTIGSVKFVH